MLPLNKNSDFKDIKDSKVINPYYDINGDKMDKEIQIYGAKALDQAIEMVLATEPGERLFNITFQSPLYQMLFDNFSNLENLMEGVYNSIEKWVPIVIDRKNTKLTKYENIHSIAFEIPYVSTDGKIKHIFSRVIGR